MRAVPSYSIMSASTPATLTTAPLGARLPNRIASPPLWLKALETGRMTSPSGSGAQATASESLPATVGTSRFRPRTPWRLTSLRMAGIPPCRCTCSTCTSGRLGEILQMCGVLAEISFSRLRSKGMPAACARARVCRMVLVDPPIATSRMKAVDDRLFGDDVERADVLIQAALQRVRRIASQRQALGVGLGLAAGIRRSSARREWFRCRAAPAPAPRPGSSWSWR